MTQRRSFYLVLLIIGLGFALRLYQLDARPFWFDENITVDLAVAPPNYVFETIDRPPVYYLLLHVWTGFVGSSPFTLRFFSVWWGTLALVFFYLLARQLADRRLSLWALLLATFSPFYIYYAQEARTYALTLALALISCWALLVWLKQRRARYLLLNAAATLGCLYTHYSLLLLPFAQTVFVLVTLWRNRRRSQPAFPTPIALGLNFYVPFPHHLPKPKFKFSRKVRPLWQWLIVQAIVVALFLPWPIHARYGLRELFAPQANPSPFTVLQQVANFVRTTLLEFSATQSLPWPLAEAIALAFVGLIVLGLLSPTLSKLSRRFLAIVLLLPPLIMLLLPRTAVYYAPKYLIMITPAFYILTVAGVEALWQARAHFFTRRVAAALGVMLFIGVPVLSIGWAAMQPFQADKTVQSLWEDDLPHATGVYLNNTALINDGISLSQSQFRRENTSPIIPDDVPRPHLEGMTSSSSYLTASNGHTYGLIYTDQKSPPQFFDFDPATGKTHSVAVVTNTLRGLLETTDGRLYGFSDTPWPIFKYDTGHEVLMQLAYPGNITSPLQTDRRIAQDGWIYGTVAAPYQALFALNLNSGEIITRAATVSALTARPGGGVYAGIGKGLWTFDSSGILTELPLPPDIDPFYIQSLATRSNGKVVGIGGISPGWYPTRFLFEYDPITEMLERLPDAFNDEVGDVSVDANDRLYATYFPTVAVFETGQYTTTGSARSEVIHPATLTFSDTIVGGYNASVAALACGQNGKVYGVKSDPATSKWLFEYDPQQLAATARQIAPDVSTEDKGRFLAGTALMALHDGRLVGGTNNGHLFVYSPTTDETRDVGQVAEGKQQIASLAVDGAGIVYGGTLSYDHRAAFFSFDPATSVAKTVALPIVDPTMIGAVTVGPAERVYVGVDRNLVIYDPHTQQSTVAKGFEYDEGLFNKRAVCTIRALIAGPDDQIYGGCGSHFFAYDTAHDTLRDLGVTEDRGSIASLTIGSDKQIYGSVEHEYMGRSNTYRDNKIFVYNPAQQRMTNLGVATKTGPVILTACGDGTIYGGSNNTNSNYSGPAYLFAFRTDCPQGAIGSWDKVTWQAQTPPGTRIVVDVMSTYGILVRNIENGGSLQAIDAQQYPQLSLRANLFTSDPNVTPILQSWRVDYTFACNNQSGSVQR